MYGTLYLCATPIGNLEDITLRVLRLLKECDVIAAEDTRHTLGLLNHFDIHTPLTSYHEHNKASKGPKLVEMLKEGKNIALVTDAGMPGISDPGADMIALCRDEGINVTVAPGAVAGITALVLSGLPTRRFSFEGFLPYDKKERREVLKSIENETRTLIFYEAPHHLKDTLKELYNALGDRNTACIRELTKKYEEVKKEPLSKLMEYYDTNPPKGEFVVVVEGISREELRKNEIQSFEEMTIDEHMLMYTEKGMSEKEAMKQVAKDRGVSKRDIYAYIHK
ncbi:MAG TPA: 16S rRNA (cytidine(1402)-2'-O)-methyltransferase [Candidatus Fimicola cottocaccae]|nr:16S rRNA (cytidine(1402)-2'-O)-methyltransferase [Candidatus Fimicola cottocaccae]